MAKRHDETARSRRPGAGRPRKQPRSSDRPVPEEILRAASTLFARRGVHATTMAQVAEAVGLQVSSIYYYFGSKHEILERIVRDVNRVPLEALDRAEAVHDDPAVQLHAFVRVDAAALCTFPFDINEIHRLAGEDEAVFGAYWTERQILNDRVEALVERGVANGSFVDVDAHLAALTVLANDEAAQNWYRPVGARRLTSRDGSAAADYRPEDVGAFLADHTLRALLADPGRLPEIRRVSHS